MFSERLFHSLIVENTKEYRCVLRPAYGGLKHCERPIVDVWIGNKDIDGTSM